MGLTITPNCELKTKNCLHCKTFPASATPACIGVIEVKTFTIQSIAEFKFGIYQV